MTKISEYPIISNPTEDDILIGTDVNSSDVTKNFSIGSIIDLIGYINQGPTGPQGNTGPTGPQGPVGPAGLEWQGVWDLDSSYVVDDAVSFLGASYFCILNINTVSNLAPDEDPTHWALLASQGALGPTGPAGPIGPQGPAGGVSYTEESVNTNQLSIAGNPDNMNSKITKNFTRAYVATASRNFLGLSNIDKDTGDFFVVQNMSTTLNLVVIPIEDAKFLQPNGVASQVNFTVKANTYARFTLTDNTSGSDKVFMVEVIKPLGAGQTLQQVTDLGATTTNAIETGNIIATDVGGGDPVLQLNYDITNSNILIGTADADTGFGHSINTFPLTAFRQIALPDADGTIALTSDITTKVIKTTITQAQILQMFTTPITILNSTTAGIAKIPLNIVCKRSGAGTNYTIAQNQFSLVSNSGNAFTLSLNNNILSGAVPVSYTTFSSNANFQISVGIDDEIYKLGFYTSNPTGGTGDMDVYVTYIEFAL